MRPRIRPISPIIHTNIQTKTNDAQGKVYFDSIEYTEAGLYQYTIEEVKGNLAGVTYDSHVIDVTVTVEDKDAQYEAAQKIFEENLSVRDTEKLVKLIMTPKPQKIKKELSHAEIYHNTILKNSSITHR